MRINNNQTPRHGFIRQVTGHFGKASINCFAADFQRQSAWQLALPSANKTRTMQRLKPAELMPELAANVFALATSAPIRNRHAFCR